MLDSPVGKMQGGGISGMGQLIIPPPANHNVRTSPASFSCICQASRPEMFIVLTPNAARKVPSGFFAKTKSSENLCGLGGTLVWHSHKSFRSVSSLGFSLPRRGGDVEAATDFAGGDKDDFGVAGDGLAFAAFRVPVEGVFPAFAFERAAMGLEVADQFPALHV